MLTTRQKAILDFVIEFRRKNGCSPSIPELQRAFDIRSPNGVAGHLLALESKGLIRRAKRGSRQIDVTGPLAAMRKETFDIPVYAKPPATAPGVAPSGCLTLDEGCLGFRPGEACYALAAHGAAMKDAGIFDGDLLVVEALPRLHAGQLVIVIENGAGVPRRLAGVHGRASVQIERPGGGGPELLPRASVLGVVRTVLRRLK